MVKNIDMASTPEMTMERGFFSAKSIIFLRPSLFCKAKSNDKDCTNVSIRLSDFFSLLTFSEFNTDIKFVPLVNRVHAAV